jgi:hypothetical protein
MLLQLIFMQETSVTLGTSIPHAWSRAVGGRRTDGWCGLGHHIDTTPEMWRGRMAWLHMLLQRLKSWVTFVALWAFDEVVGTYSWSAGTSSPCTDAVNARSWRYGFTHAGSWQRYCGQTWMSVIWYLCKLMRWMNAVDFYGQILLS